MASSRITAVHPISSAFEAAASRLPWGRATIRVSVDSKAGLPGFGVSAAADRRASATAAGTGYDAERAMLDEATRGMHVLLDAPRYVAVHTRGQVTGLTLVTTAAMGALTTSIHHAVEVSVHLLGA